MTEITNSSFRFLILVPATFAVAHLMVKYVEVPFGRYRKARFKMPAKTSFGASASPAVELPTT